MKRISLVFIIVIQLLFIGIIIKHIHNKSVLGITSINPLPKDTITSSSSEKLQHFYEPVPNSVTKAQPIFAGLENISYTINKDGLNQLEDYPLEKEKNTYRIVTIGDSFTFGLNVTTKENYPSQLRTLLNQKLSCSTIKKFEILNLGVPGYDIQYTVERFKQKGLPYNPDLVIWLVFEGDLKRINELFQPKYKRYLKESKEKGTYKKYLENGIFYAEWQQAMQDSIEELGGEDAILASQKIYMRELNTFYSGSLLILPLPQTQEKYKQFLEDFSQERKNTLFYDKLPNIFTIPNALLPDGHASSFGYKLLAEDIKDYLLDEKILDCSIK